MNFYLTNVHRKYMGLKPIKDDYELVIVKGKEEEHYLFFDGDIIRKTIDYEDTRRGLVYTERDVHYETCDNKANVLPRTNRGKIRKLTATTINSFDGEGNYFAFYRSFDNQYARARIGNYTTQKTFYEDDKVESHATFDDIKIWCDKFVAESTDKDLKEVEAFSKEERKHVNYKKGDYFRVKFDRNLYGYGRILLDVYKEQKAGLDYWNILMGRPIIVEMFHILTPNSNLKVEDIENLQTFPSQHIMDNRLYYGEYEIIGHKELPSNLKYPIMYGKSEEKVIFQCGKIHREINLNNCKVVEESFTNNGIGFYLDVDKDIIRKCIEAKSNNPYWEKMIWQSKYDLRSPQNKDNLKKVLKQFDLEYLIDIYND